MSKRTDWTIKQTAMWFATHNDTGATLVACSREALMMTWYTTADAARDAQRQGANKSHAGLLDSMRSLLDKPQTSKLVTGQNRVTTAKDKHG